MKNGKIVNKVSVACLSKMIYNVPKPMAQIAIDHFLDPESNDEVINTKWLQDFEMHPFS